MAPALLHHSTAMARSRSRRRHSGFTLVEVLVTVLVIAILALITVPALQKLILRNQLISVTRQAGVLMQLARMEAIRQGVATVVIADFDAKEVVAFVNSERNLDGTYNDLAFDPTAGERELGRFPLPSRVVFWGPPDGAPEGANAMTFGGAAPTPPFPANTTIPGAVFMTDGSVLAVGAIRFADAAGNNFLEVNVAPRATARPLVRKYNANGPVSGLLWYESGLVSGGRKSTWEWN
jgi:prepilin-type N-terminal cleavage/methylation domain-containing protein